MKIFGFLKSTSGCDWYRIKQPLIHIKAEKTAEVKFFHKGDDFDWFASTEAAEKLEKCFEWADILFIPRISEPRMMDVLHQFKKLGKKVVTEWDDDVFSVSPLTQQYGYFGTEEYSYDLNGEKLEVWKDGKNIDIAANKAQQANIKEALKMSDMVLTTTDELADVFRPFNPNIRVCPNSVNTQVWKKLPLLDHRGIRVGWFGGDTHYHDWLMIAPVMRAFLEKYPQAKLVLMGAKYDGTLKGINPDQIEHHHGVDIAAYPYKAAVLDLDFAVIPLVKSTFNNGKSPIKWLEMGALEVPSITSYVNPYIKMMDLVPDNGIFIEENDLASWFNAMCMMVEDPKGRRTMGLNARKTVERHFDAFKTHDIWLKAFEDCLKGGSPSLPQATPQLAVL